MTAVELYASHGLQSSAHGRLEWDNLHLHPCLAIVHGFRRANPTRNGIDTRQTNRHEKPEQSKTHLFQIPNSRRRIHVLPDLLHDLLLGRGDGHHDGAVDRGPLAFFWWRVEGGAAQDPEAGFDVGGYGREMLAGFGDRR